MSGESDDVDKLLAAVADGESIDWDALERDAPDDETLAVVRQLRLVAAVADVHRSAPDDTGPDPDAVMTMSVGGTVAGHLTSAETRRIWPDVARSQVATAVGAGIWGHLRLVRMIGEGSFGEVYHAHDTWLDHPVALKLLKREAEARVAPTQLLHEARKLARVRHTNVVAVHGADRHNGRVGFWMDLIDGETLATRVSRGRLSAGEAVSVGQEVCRALAAVHQAKLIHRDVKAQNVMRAHDGGRIILMDFGAGEFVGDRLGRHAHGTPLYLAPELLRGEDASVQSDIYAVGVLLYHLVTGRFPVEGASVLELATAHVRGERRRLRDERPDLPESFITIVERAIDPDPARRYASAGEMEAKLSGEPSTRPISVAATAVSRERKRGRFLTPIVTGAALAIFLTIIAGAITSTFYYVAFGISESFRQESPLGWPLWGLRSLLAPVVLVGGAASVAFVLFTLLYRLGELSGSPLRRVVRPLTATAGRVVSTIRDAPTTVSGAMLLMAQLAGVALTWWWFSPLLGALDGLLGQKAGADLTPLSPTNIVQQRHYREAISVLFIVSIWAWASLLRIRSQRREHAGMASIVGGLAITFCALLLSVLPYRIFSHNEHERVTFRSQPCYLLGIRGDSALLFCPLQEPPRNRIVKVDDAALDRGGPEENMFTLLGSPVK